MVHNLPGKLRGKIIYATPGSGKTYIADKYDNAIDADDLMIEAACELSPDFVLDDDADDPRTNVHRYCFYKKWNRRALDRWYERTVELMRDHAADGEVVLTGSYRLMEEADLVFLSTNYVRTGFKQEKEKKELNDQSIRSRIVHYFDTYFEVTLLQF
jgi:hypothetical protein